MQQLAGHFSSFVQIPKVAELSGRLSALQKSLQMNVQREFELLGVGEDNPNPLLLDRLRACCLVVDALGFSVRPPHQHGATSFAHHFHWLQNPVSPL